MIRSSSVSRSCLPAMVSAWPSSSLTRSVDGLRGRRPGSRGSAGTRRSAWRPRRRAAAAPRTATLMNGLAASRPWATTSSVGAVLPSSLIRCQAAVVASASTIMIATSSPAIRPATTMSKTADSSCSWVGNATHWSSMRATRVAPIGPVNGRPDSWVDTDAALIATTSYRSLGSSAMTVMTTWTSLRRPLAKDGRSGRSMRRQVRIASSDGPALAAEERAGDPAGGVHPLLDVDREREEVEVLLGVLAGRGGRQQHGVVVEVGGDGAGGLAGEAAGLEADGAGAEASRCR